MPFPPANVYLQQLTQPNARYIKRPTRIRKTRNANRRFDKKVNAMLNDVIHPGTMPNIGFRKDCRRTA